ncbi:MAG: 4Fe-4S dicluster domain-containing protein [Pirellula sp.]
MLDKRSLIVTYDIHRGEPRHKGKALVESKAGDCIDCGHCTQCIDACDAVMGRIGRPEGLIR